MPDFPVTVTDDWGDEVIINVPQSGNVTLRAALSGYLTFGPQQYEAFSKAWVAAGHEMDRRRAAGHG